MAKATNWTVLRAKLPQRYTVPIAEKIKAFIEGNPQAARDAAYEALTPRQVELVFKGKIKDSLKVACVFRFAMELKAEEAIVRKMLVPQKRVKRKKKSKV